MYIACLFDANTSYIYEAIYIQGSLITDEILDRILRKLSLNKWICMVYT